MIGTGVKTSSLPTSMNPTSIGHHPGSGNVPSRSLSTPSQEYVTDPKKLAGIQETVGETSSQSVVVAVDRYLCLLLHIVMTYSSCIALSTFKVESFSDCTIQNEFFMFDINVKITEDVERTQGECMYLNVGSNRRMFVYNILLISINSENFNKRKI